MKNYIQIPNAISNATRLQIIEQLQSNPRLGPSPLAGPFEHTRGLAWSFSSDGIKQLSEQGPVFKEIIRVFNLPQGYLGLRKWYHKGFAHPFNAFYLNILLIPPGPGVGPHVDATLKIQAQMPNLLPKIVSVLWLDMPPHLEGGQLKLYNNENKRPMAIMTPNNGDMVHFKGSLSHEITPIHKRNSNVACKPTYRISLVCEQYRLPLRVLQKFAPFTRHTRVRFKSFLERAKQNPTVSFKLD